MAKKVKETENKNLKEVNKDEKLPKTEKELLEEAQTEIEKWHNKYMMVYADMENAKRQNEKTLMEAIKYRASGFVESLIPSLDAFRLALNNEVEHEVVKNYLIGFRHVYKNILLALESEGLKEIVPQANDEFDYKIMHAIDTEESELEENRVVRVITSAFMLKDRLLRPAMVILSKKPVKVEEDQPKNEDENLTQDSNNKLDA